jgi:hypothetical protein
MLLVSGRESRILYCIDDATRIHYVYALIDVKQNTLIWELKELAAYVKRQYNLDIKKWRHDRLGTMDCKYDDWILEDGYIVEMSALYTQA